MHTCVSTSAVLRLLNPCQQGAGFWLGAVTVPAIRWNSNRSGKYRSTRDRTFPLTYEMHIRPWHIGAKKAWLTWHTSNLDDFRAEQPYRVVEDEIIRRFIRGIWMHDREIFVNELIIKRRANAVYVAGIIRQDMRLSVQQIYWLIGYTEELLSLILKQPIKLELQTVKSKEDVVFKYI